MKCVSTPLTHVPSLQPLLSSVSDHLLPTLLGYNLLPAVFEIEYSHSFMGSPLVILEALHIKVDHHWSMVLARVHYIVLVPPVEYYQYEALVNTSYMKWISVNVVAI